MKKIGLLIIFCFGLSHSMKAQVNLGDSLALVDLYNQCNGPNWNNSINWLTDPVGSWYGITVSGDRVSRIILDNNNLVGAVPNSLQNLSSLTTLYIYNNELHSLPDLHNLPLCTVPLYNDSLDIRNNYFTFYDIEDNNNDATDPGRYSPQKPIPINQSEYAINNDTLILNAQSLSLYPLGGGALFYSWSQEGFGTVSNYSPNPEYIKHFYPSSDTGIYICSITNAMVPGLTLTLEPIHVSIGGVSIGNPAREQDSLALISLYNELNGDSWLNNTNWKSSTEPLNTYYGVRLWNDRVVSLHLQGNNLNGSIPISISPLTEIMILNLSNNSINDIYPLRFLLQIDTLLLGNNNISDISSLESIPGLNWIDLQNNNISDISPLANNPDITGIMNYINLKSNPLNEDAYSTYIPLLKARGVRVIYDPPGNEIINESDSLALVALYNNCNGPNWINKDNWLSGKVSSWYGVQVENNRVVALNLDYNNSSGTLPSEFGNLNALQVLRFSETNFSDYSVLSNLTELTYLHLNNCGISDLSFAASLINIQEISLNDNNLSDLTSLTSLINLHQLNINNNSLVDITTLGNSPNIYVLHANNCSINNISALEFFQNLEVILLNDNNIEDLSPLLNNSALGEGDYVELVNNPLNEQAFNTHIPALQARGVNVNYDSPPNGFVYVSPTGVDSPENGSMHNPYATINYALNYFIEGDTLVLLNGIYDIGTISLFNKKCIICSNYLFSNHKSDIDNTIIKNDYKGSAFEVIGEATFIGITFENNGGETAFGGAIKTSWDSGKIRVEDCVFKNNSAIQEGGAIWVWGGNASLEANRCVFDGNTALVGSAILVNWNGKAMIKNSLFINNSAVNEGTVSNWESRVTINNCSFVNNVSESGSISGFNNSDSPEQTDTPVGIVRNSIFIGNGSADIGYWNTPPDVKYTNTKRAFPGEGNSTIFPDFVSETDFHLRTTSELINAGTPDTTGLNVGLSDLDGLDRIQDSRIDIGCYEGGSDNWIVEDPVFFPDLSLRQAISDALKVRSDKLTPSRLEYLTELVADDCDPPISDLTGLEKCTNLVYLELLNNNISSISQIAYLQKLETLYLDGNIIAGIWPVKNLTNIIRISFQNNNITSLIDLGEKPNLIGIDISQNRISDFSLLRNYPTLEWIMINDNTATTLADIHDFPNVWTIVARDLNLKTVQGLTNMPNLNRLHLARNQISDISFTNNFNLSGGFEIPWNNVSDISPLANQTELPWLSLHHNPITDISSLTSSPNITQIWLEHCNISDISPLSQMDSLITLRLNDNQITTLKPLLDCASLDILQIANNPLSNKTIIEDYSILRPRLSEIDQEQIVSDLIITYPNSTSGVVQGKTIEISWQEFGGTGTAEKVNLNYSIDGGANWIPILSNEANNYSKMWTVPNLGGQQFILKIEDADVPLFVRDTSETISFCSLTANFTSVKNNLEISFTNTSTGNNNSWYWDFGDGNYSIQENPVHNYQTAGVYDINFTAIDLSSGCKSAGTSSIEAGTVACIALFDTSFIADSRSVAFTDFSSGIIEEYSWDFGDNSKSNELNPLHTYKEDGIYKACLTVRNSSTNYISTSCKVISIVTIPDIIAPVASFSYIKNDADLKVEFLNTTTGDATNWNWTYGDGSFYNGQESSHIYSKYGSYKVCLNVSNNILGLNSSQCKDITVGNPPCAIISNFNYILNEETLTLKVNNLSSDEADAWYWDFGDGTSSSLKTPSHIYSKPGIYTIGLTSKNTVTKCFDFHSEEIIIGSVDCIANFSSGIDMLTKTVTFKNLSSEQSDIFYWNFGDGSTSKTANPSHTYSEPGKYNVRLTVSDNSGLCMDEMEKQIQIQAIECGADFESFIDSSTMTIYLNPIISGSYTSLYWDLGDGFTSSSDEVVYTYKKAGYYTIKLTSYNSETLCMDYHQKVVMISSPGVDVNADYIYTVDDPTRTVNFHNTSSGDNGIYIWDFGDGITSSENNPIYAYNEGGFYDVCLIAFGNNENQSTRCKTIPVSPEDISNCLASYNYMVDSASLSAQFVDISMGGINTWEWDFEDGSSSTEQDPQHSWEVPGYYVVHLRATNIQTGCFSDFSNLINVGMYNDSVITRFDYQRVDERFKASGHPLDFTGISIGEKSKITWDFGDGTTNSTTLNPRHYFPELEQYNVCLTIEDPNTGKSSTYCEYVQVVGTVGVEEISESFNSDQDIVLSVYPNPSDNGFTINYSIQKQQYINLGIFDIQGRCLDVLTNEQNVFGDYELYDVGKDLKPGIYFIILKSVNKTMVKKVVKT